MATYGLGKFMYDIIVEDKQAKFSFYDPEDATNTAEVTLTEKDFPEGVTAPDTREVAEAAFAQCQKLLNEKRDARVRRERTTELDEQLDQDKHDRETAADFLASSGDHAAPAKDQAAEKKADKKAK